MWFGETFEKTVISDSVQITFSCWPLGGDGTRSQLSPICFIDHIWQLQSFIFFSCRYDFSLSYSPKIAKAGLDLYFFAEKAIRESYFLTGD